MLCIGHSARPFLLICPRLKQHLPRGRRQGYPTLRHTTRTRQRRPTALAEIQAAERGAEFARMAVAAPTAPHRSLRADNESPSRCTSIGIVASSRARRPSKDMLKRSSF